jgi:hypothetical protein
MFKEVCLLIRCLAVDVLLRAFSSAAMCLPSCCLAMGIHVTIIPSLRTPCFLNPHGCKAAFTKLNFVVLVRKRTIPIELPQLVGEVSANFS